MNVKEALNWGKNELRKGDVLEPDSSATILLSDVLAREKRKEKREKSWGRADTLAHPEKELTKTQLAKFRRYIARRRKHESVWHIIGKVQFCDLDFIVNKDVLVPRPETELLVQEVIKVISSYELRVTSKNSKLANSKISHKSEIITHKYSPTVLDVGTGSGTIAIALAHKYPELQIDAVDVSRKALVVARKNAKRNGVNNTRFFRSNLFSCVKGKYDIITANLPYIPSEDMESLSVDVHHYEPKLALDGGAGGSQIYEQFLSQVSGFINPGARIFCEIGINQGNDFKKLVKDLLPEAKVNIMGDLAGIDRIAIIEMIDK